MLIDKTGRGRHSHDDAATAQKDEDQPLELEIVEVGGAEVGGSEVEGGEVGGGGVEVLEIELNN